MAVPQLLTVVCSCLLLTTVTAQLSIHGICSSATGGQSQCFNADVPGTCPSRWSPHPYLGQPGMLWACGGWWATCCSPAATTTTAPPAPPPPALDEADCGLGKPLGRILKGFNTSKCDYPFVVSIRARLEPGVQPLVQANTGPACGGVIINRYWILTHAVCCYLGVNQRLSDAPSDLLVVSGEYDTEKLEQDPRGGGLPLEQFIPITRCIPHPSYPLFASLRDVPISDSLSVNGNGLALIKLAQPVNNYCGSTACLPSAPPLTSPSCDTFTQCVITGWGLDVNFTRRDSTLKQGYVTIYKNSVCDFLQGTLFSASRNLRFTGSACQTNSTAQIINDSCLGDQGGPVLCYDGVRWTVQGVLPFNMCYQNEINPYVLDVKQAETWIRSTIISNP